ncbi:hypothetical protein EPD60_02440 [Flaviaesturariibacter flavus]|uniref:Beta-1,6-galactofuranosyltransferase n=1 Tax=Flaviaesturariibacter flavus TaxID=2502780 RepID=A0A4R1BPV2_9BACT|nr:hypothetical protein [Flaviaesturariibacter flavus]TCJ19296.1 hypothetical protein EPD60_02440 [Flaviaesturariibacter flavus]
MPEVRIDTGLYFLAEHSARGALVHGGVGNVDIERILVEDGWQPVAFGDQENFSGVAKIRRTIRMLRTLASLPRGATLLLQWPVYAGQSRMLLRGLRRFRTDVRIICFLTDINGLKDADPALLERELAVFRGLTHFVAHNDTMRDWLLEKLPAARVATIDFFDFLAPWNAGERVPAPELCFAGNLEKSPFIARLGSLAGLRFHLYGAPAVFIPTAPNCSYHGSFPPAVLPARVAGAYGLIWDGTEISKHGGALGTYARWISPHKMSLYILAGMPVVCHSGSAAARLAEKYGIGFGVDSLFELEARIAALPPEEYASMRDRMAALAPGIAAGDRLRAALRELSGA